MRCLPHLPLFVALFVVSCAFVSLEQVNVLRNVGGFTPRHNPNCTLTATKEEQRQVVPPSHMTGSRRSVTCPPGLFAVTDSFHLPPSTKHSKEKLIPRIMHQTSKSRCLTPKMVEQANAWRERLPGYEYYFWDDEAVDALLQRHFPEFPHVSTISKCLDKSARTIKGDLWRYVVLWEYGGIYADLDSGPNKFNDSTIMPETDAFFVIESFALLSQYFMAAAPRHPLMYYTILRTLSNVISAKEPGQRGAPGISGPHALHNGFVSFMRDANVTAGDSRKYPLPEGGVFHGSFGRSVTAVGSRFSPDDIVRRETINSRVKKEEYAKMGMVHFSDTNAAQNLERNKFCDTLMLEEEVKRTPGITSKAAYSSKLASAK